MGEAGTSAAVLLYEGESSLTNSQRTEIIESPRHCRGFFVPVQSGWGFLFMPKRVLFLCSGNYYRSRFAEILFNHFAKARGLDWHADSRGLAKEFGKWNVGPISPYTVKAIEER